jgi:hypothetical protein
MFLAGLVCFFFFFLFHVEDDANCVVASGMVSQYSLPPGKSFLLRGYRVQTDRTDNRYGIKNLTSIVPKRIRFQGFLVNDADFGPKYVKERDERVPKVSHPSFQLS